jgi:hypothetical protein
LVIIGSILHPNFNDSKSRLYGNPSMIAIFAPDHNPSVNFIFDSSHIFDGKISSSHSTIETLIVHDRALAQRYPSFNLRHFRALIEIAIMKNL